MSLIAQAVIPAIRKVKQEDLEFKSTLGNLTKLCIKKKNELSIVAHTFYPRTLEAEKGKSLEFEDSEGLQSKLQDGQGYTE